MNHSEGGYAAFCGFCMCNEMKLHKTCQDHIDWQLEEMKKK